MDADKLAEFAIARIKDVLGDDANYQHASLKLGGIWNWCVMAAEFERHGDRIGSHIEVKMRPGIGARMETPPEYGPNVGHGHVWPRADGVKARCGGPGLCKVCAEEQTEYRRKYGTEP